MSSAAFPRGGLKSDEPKDPKQEKKEKTQAQGERRGPTSDAQAAPTVKAPTQGAGTAAAVDAARRPHNNNNRESGPRQARQTKTRPLRELPCRDDGAGRRAVHINQARPRESARGTSWVMWMSPGALQLTPNTVVRCAVLSTSRAGAAPGSKKGPKRVELAIDARGVQKGLRLEDIASNRVTTLFGLVASRKRGATSWM